MCGVRITGMVGGREAGASCTGGAQIRGMCMKVSRLVGHAWDHFRELGGSVEPFFSFFCACVF